MAKVKRGIPEHVQKARLRDYYINKEYQERQKLTYPECIGTFPECSNLKSGSIISDCKLCPHFCSKSFSKLNGGTKMKEKTKQDVPVKAKVEKADKEKERQEKIQKMVDNYEHLKPAARAWVKIYASKGMLSDEQLEKIGFNKSELEA